MNSNNLYLKESNKLGHLSLSNHKFKKSKKTNNRYQNFQNNDIMFHNSNLSNNKLVYESYNKKGYNGMIDPSLSGNNNFLIITNSVNDPYQNLNNTINKKKSFTKMNKPITNSQIEKNSYQSIFKKPENKRLLDSNKLLSTASYSNFPKKTLIDDNLFNNIGFKEIK